MTKSVNMYYKDSDDLYKVLKFSLADSVLQFSSAVFTVNHFNLTMMNQTQEDINFILYNVYNDFLAALLRSSNYYVNDIEARRADKNRIIIIVIAAALGTVFLSMVVVLPAIGNVSKTNLQVLSLFAFIPTVQVTSLAAKCERFIFKVCSNEHDEDRDNDDDDDSTSSANGNVDDSDQKVGLKRREIKVPKNAQGASLEYIFMFGIAAFFISGYFIAMYVISHLYISQAGLLTDEINTLS